MRPWGRKVGQFIALWHHVGLIDERRYWFDAEYHARWYRLALIAACSGRPPTFTELARRVMP